MNVWRKEKKMSNVKSDVIAFVVVAILVAGCVYLVGRVLFPDPRHLEQSKPNASAELVKTGESEVHSNEYP